MTHPRIQQRRELLVRAPESGDAREEFAELFSLLQRIDNCVKGISEIVSDDRIPFVQLGLYSTRCAVQMASVDERAALELMPSARAMLLSLNAMVMAIRQDRFERTKGDC